MNETNCINVENANGVQYLESPESPDHRSEFEATHSLSTDIPEYRCLLIGRVQYLYTIEHAVENIAYYRC